jgi:hypothetical protein
MKIQALTLQSNHVTKIMKDKDYEDLMLPLRIELEEVWVRFQPERDGNSEKDLNSNQCTLSLSIWFLHVKIKEVTKWFLHVKIKEVTKWFLHVKIKAGKKKSHQVVFACEKSTHSLALEMITNRMQVQFYTSNSVEASTNDQQTLKAAQYYHLRSRV